MNRKNETVEVRVRQLRWECDGVLSLVLEPLSGALPMPRPGAHVDLHLPGGGLRQYSLTAGSSDRAYVLGILKAPKSRGGSVRIHETIRPGDCLTISTPRNAFPLVEDADPVLLIGGGIGLTPILAMAEELASSGEGRDWSLIACVRSKQALPFAGTLAALGAQIHVDEEQGPPDLSALISGAGANSHLYCCGPAPMLEAFLQATADRDPAHVHIERFEQTRPKAGEGELVVELARSGQSVVVASDKTILDALLAAGLEPEHSCRVGVCGSCECQVLGGEPDHRDLILTDDEHEQGRFLICCSRARGQHLVLDL